MPKGFFLHPGRSTGNDPVRAIARLHDLRVWRAAADGTLLTELSPRPAGTGEGQADAEGWLRFLHPADRERVRTRWRRALRAGTPFQAEYRLLQDDGGYRWKRGQGVALRDADGTVRQWIGTIADIHDEVAARSDLARSQERLRLALEHADPAIWDLDLSTGEIWCAPAAARLLGHPGVEVLAEAQAWANLHPDDARRFGEQLGDAMAGRDAGRFELEFRLLDPSGVCTWLTGSGRTLFDVSGLALRVLGVLHDVTGLRRQEQRRFHQAHHDPLTGLPNRRLLALHAAARLQRDEALAVLLLDIDGFKLVNDTLGHQQADELLAAIGRRLEGELSPLRLTVGRLGGDKFAVLAPGLASAEAAGRIAARIQDALAEPFAVRDQMVPVAGSIGIALSPAHGRTAEELFGNADLALHNAKAAAPSLVRVFVPRLRQEVEARQTLDADLRGALERQEFTLFYQPQVNLADGRVTGMEALLRWKHPGRGLLAPIAFLPVLERTPMVMAVGEWVARQAIADAAALRARGLPLRVAINLFSAQFRGGGIPAMLREGLREFALPPGQVEVEVTENVILTNDESLPGCMAQIRDLGCGIAFDDFGTGHASLSMLKRYPLTRLKIDRSFVMDLHASREDSAIVDAILSPGRTFEVAVTAEGIETPTQEAVLRERGCDDGQGYLFGRPMPLDELAALLR